MNVIPELTRKPYDKYEAANRVAAAMTDQKGGYIGGAGSSVEIEFGARRFRPDKGVEYFHQYLHYGTPMGLVSENGLTAWVPNKTYSSTSSAHRGAVLSALYRAGFKATGKAIWREDMAASRYYRSLENIEYTEYKRSAADRDKSREDHARETWKSTKKTPYVPAKDRPKPGPVVFYKVLSEEGHAIHGGHFEYDLPELIDGTWEPGAWTPVIEEVDLCMKGYHVTEYPQKWFPFGRFRVFEVEYRGSFEYERIDHKVAFQSIRLVRELSRMEAAGIKPNKRAYNDREIKASAWSMKKEKVA